MIGERTAEAEMKIGPITREEDIGMEIRGRDLFRLAEKRCTLRSA